MTQEYIIVSKTAIEKRINQLKPTLLFTNRHEGEIKALENILSQSTSLIPEVKGYKECLEDNKDKRFSEEDLRKELASLALEIATEDGELKSCSPSLIYSWIEKRIKSLTQPKDTWECEFIDGQLKLK